MDEFDWKFLVARLTDTLDEMMDRFADLLDSEFSRRPNDPGWKASEALLMEARTALNDGSGDE